MKYDRWDIGDYDRAAAERLRSAGFPPLLAAVLAARGVKTPEEAAPLLEQSLEPPHDPLQMRDMDKAVERIRLALHRRERIAVFGDYDVDGITSTVLLVDYLRSQGADCLKYIPRRMEDGYGLGCDALSRLCEQGVSLVISVDCGITAVEEAAFTRTLGMDLVITDHHECRNMLPEAVAVVDPRRQDCPYPFKHLAGVGVALKLVLALSGGRCPERCYTLAAIGTVADVMRMSGENRAIVRRGLSTIRQTDLVGLRALLEESGLTGRTITATQIGYTLAPRINAAGRMGAADLAADLLLTQDAALAQKLARELCELNRSRQQVEQEIFSQAVEMIEDSPAEERHALVLASEGWHQGVVGIVASRISDRYSCPSFMIYLQDGAGKGSCRSYGGFNLFAALTQCADLLDDYGGHELAAGFNIREECIPAFRHRMNQIISEFYRGEKPVSTLKIDVELASGDVITQESVDALGQLEPYGTGNGRPVFALRNAMVEQLQPVGQKRHLRLRLRSGDNVLEGIFFSVTEETCTVAVGERADVAFYLQVNEFRGNRYVQLQVLDVRPVHQGNRQEKEDLRLLHRFLNGGSITAEEARRMLPGREQFERLWRGLGRLEERRELLSALRQLAVSIDGEERFLRAAVSLEIFAERGLIDLATDDGLLEWHRRTGCRANLEQSAHMLRLRRTLRDRG